MDLNVVVWIGGMLFSLGIFALKVGLGLGCGKVGIKGITLTLAGYTALFMLIAVAAERLIWMLEPLLGKGGYLHALLSAGMILWGSIMVVRGSRTRRCGYGGHEARFLNASLLLIIPCPVCLTATIFSTWAALTVVKQPALLVGLALGAAFAVMALLVTLLTRGRTNEKPETSLGLAMIMVGLYLLASLYLPARIEAAKGMYVSYITENQTNTGQDGIWVLLFMLMLILIGCFAGKKGRKCK